MEVEARLSKIRELTEEGFTASEIIEKLQISKSTYYRMLSKINDSGLSNSITKDNGHEPEINPDIQEGESDIEETPSNRIISPVIFTPSCLKIPVFCAVSFFKPAIWMRALALLGSKYNNSA